MAAETPEERRERWRSVAIGGKRSGAPTLKYKPRPIEQPKWEATPVKDHRGVPFVHASNGKPVTAKQFSDNRGGFEKQINHLRSSPTPLKGDS